jgi:hypothetical protein
MQRDHQNNRNCEFNIDRLTTPVFWSIYNINHTRWTRTSPHRLPHILIGIACVIKRHAVLDFIWNGVVLDFIWNGAVFVSSLLLLSCIRFALQKKIPQTLCYGASPCPRNEILASQIVSLITSRIRNGVDISHVLLGEINIKLISWNICAKIRGQYVSQIYKHKHLAHRHGFCQSPSVPPPIIMQQWQPHCIPQYLYALIYQYKRSS